MPREGNLSEFLCSVITHFNVPSWWCLCSKNEMPVPPEDMQNYAENRAGKFVRALSERCSENTI